jgi:gamma-polyglutamate synthase
MFRKGIKGSLHAQNIKLLLQGSSSFEEKVYKCYIEQVLQGLYEQGIYELGLLELLGRVIFLLKEKHKLFHQRQQEFNRFVLIPNHAQEELAWFAKRLNERAVWQKESKKPTPSREALTDLYYARQGELQQQIYFLLNRFKHLGSSYLESKGRWSDFDFLGIIDLYLQFSGDSRLRTELISAVAKFVAILNVNSLVPSLSSKSSPFGLSVCLEVVRNIVSGSDKESAEEVWVQCAAYELIAAENIGELVNLAKKRFRVAKNLPNDSEDLFVRDFLIKLLIANDVVKGLDQELLDLCQGDSSSFVRQAASELMVAAGEITRLSIIAVEDKDQKVRAVAITALTSWLIRNESSEQAQPYWHKIEELLVSEKSSFLLRSILRSFINFSCSKGRESIPDFIIKCLKLRLSLEKDPLLVKCLAECYWELWSRKPIYKELKDLILKRKSNFGKSFVIRKSELKNIAEEDFFKLLLAVASQGYGFDVKTSSKSYKIYCGFKYQRRLWRLIYEFCNPASDKRQAHKHLQSRSYVGDVRITSELCCEVTPAKVPGEPVLVRRLGGWFSSLPLLEDVLFTLKRCIKKPFAHREKKKIRIYSLQGVTYLTPPSILLSCLGYLKICLSFKKIAAFRIDPGDGQELFARFKEEVSSLGLKITTFEHSFLLLAPFIFSGEPYLVSSIQLMFVVATIFVFYLWSFIVENNRIDNYRAAIPLVIGGWGSRGKSGTERLKAALFNGMGLSIVSKSTGCEAMIVVGRPFDKTHEISLFRAYDKATIWEQRDVLKFSYGFQPQVFLWECMGLNPTYVSILRRWMRDDYSTITNTYPDHEDIQGPSGIDVAKTISEFIPPKGIVVCTEEQMYPFLQEAASLRSSQLILEGWYEAGVLTDDILSRFPYLEHPYNIALVVRLAKELGIERSLALKEMADRVVADLGVLKISPIAKVEDRRIQFINGMSANERTGCLNNWSATGFTTSDFDENSDEVLVGVVNNRADRVARSKVFAQIIVQDLNADIYLLIGSNLSGLQGMLKEEWGLFINSFTFFSSDDDPTQSGQRLVKLAKRLRVPTDENALAQRLKVVRELDSSSPYLDFWQNSLSRFINFQEKIGKTLIDVEKIKLEKELKDFFSEIFFAKIKVLTDKNASGEEVIMELVSHLPRGLFARVMGLQNIKGTGLDFVYQWEKWSNLYKSCQLVIEGGSAQINKGSQQLLEYSYYGILSKEKIQSLVQKNGSEIDPTKLKAIKSILASQDSESLKTNTVRTTLVSKLKYKFLRCIASIFEVSRAIDRKLRAKKIYSKLICHEISYESARGKLWKLYKEQDGEWLG